MPLDTTPADDGLLGGDALPPAPLVDHTEHEGGALNGRGGTYDDDDDDDDTDSEGEFEDRMAAECTLMNGTSPQVRKIILAGVGGVGLCLIVFVLF